MRALLLTVAAGALALAACDQADDTAADMDAAPAAEMAEEAPAEDTAAAEPPTEEPASAPVYAAPANAPAHIQRAVASAERTPLMTERDFNRKPAEMLMTARVEEGDRIAEIAGFGQYFTTMLADAVGPEGHVYVFDLPYTEERAGEASRAFADAHDNVDYTVVDYNDIELPSDLDAVHIVLYYHDLPLNDVDTAAFNQKVYDALKPGGIYFIVDHNAPAGTGTELTESVHRIDPQVIREDVTAAGFNLAEESDLLRNPDDDMTAMIFSSGTRGTTDQSVFVFQKPG
jgi:predicted methyltransferase